MLSWKFQLNFLFLLFKWILFSKGIRMNFKMRTSVIKSIFKYLASHYFFSKSVVSRGLNPPL